MIESIINIWKWFTWYQVIAMDRNSGYAHTWWARNEADALEWMQCYRACYSVVYGKRNTMLGGRRRAVVPQHAPEPLETALGRLIKDPLDSARMRIEQNNAFVGRQGWHR